jgi:hypothetical protein
VQQEQRGGECLSPREQTTSIDRTAAPSCCDGSPARGRGNKPRLGRCARARGAKTSNVYTGYIHMYRMEFNTAVVRARMRANNGRQTLYMMISYVFLYLACTACSKARYGLRRQELGFISVKNHDLYQVNPVKQCEILRLYNARL